MNGTEDGPESVFFYSQSLSMRPCACIAGCSTGQRQIPDLLRKTPSTRRHTVGAVAHLMADSAFERLGASGAMLLLALVGLVKTSVLLGS